MVDCQPLAGPRGGWRARCADPDAALAATTGLFYSTDTAMRFEPSVFGGLAHEELRRSLELLVAGFPPGHVRAHVLDSIDDLLGFIEAYRMASK